MSNYTFSCFVNVSSNSTSDFAWIVKHPENDVHDVGYCVATVVSLLLLLAVPWNLLVIIAILKKRLYTQPTVMLLLNLTVTNLLFSLLVMPFNIYVGIKGEYVFGNSDQQRCAVCQTGIFVIILPWVSLHTLTLISVDRFIYLKIPMKYGTMVTKLRMFVTIAVVWVFCTVLALPPLFGFGEINFSYTVATCVPILVGETHIAPNYYYAMLLLAEVSIPITILFVMYVWIVCIIKSSLVRKLRRSVSVAKNPDKAESANNKSASRAHAKSQKRMVWLFGAIFTANIITWLPMIGLVISTAVLGTAHTLAYTIPFLSYLSETVIHPVLEVCLVRNIKMAILEYCSLLGKVCGVCRLKKTNKIEDTACTDIKMKSNIKDEQFSSHKCMEDSVV